MVESRDYSWENYVLFFAAIYNLLWGAWVIIFPEQSFTLVGAEVPSHLEIWQCVGMIVGVYGVGYYIAALSPYRHWPIIFVGWLGKILGPIGFIDALYRDVFPIKFGIHIVFNDLIWWVPFSLILYKVWDKNGVSLLLRIRTKEKR